MNITNIIKGHYNEFINAQNELSEMRLKICRICPLFKKTAIGPVCNSNLYLDVKTNKTSLIPEDGYKKGCGCRLNAKTRTQDANCPLDKW